MNYLIVQQPGPLLDVLFHRDVDVEFADKMDMQSFICQQISKIFP